MNYNKFHKYFSICMLIAWAIIGGVCLAKGEFPFVTSICLWVLVLFNYIADSLRDK